MPGSGGTAFWAAVDRADAAGTNTDGSSSPTPESQDCERAAQASHAEDLERVQHSAVHELLDGAPVDADAAGSTTTSNTHGAMHIL